jgi:hypothetical protein
LASVKEGIIIGNNRVYMLQARISRAEMLEVFKITHGLEGVVRDYKKNTFLKRQRE